MKLAVVSCWKYRDCWNPCLVLLDTFWPDHPNPVALLTDEIGDFRFTSKRQPLIFCAPTKYRWPWCKVVEHYARTVTEPILLLQEDFLLTKPVDTAVVEHAAKLLEQTSAGMIRLYPSPGGTQDIGDPLFAEVPRGTPYRISCHASLWNPDYLAHVAQGAAWTTGEAGDFENLGSPFSDGLAQPVLAYKRELDWPMDYLASAIRRGQWEPDAIKLCAEHKIDLDRSMREVWAAPYK